MYTSKRALPREQHTSTSLRSSANEALLHVLGICRIWYKSRRCGICTNSGVCVVIFAHRYIAKYTSARCGFHAKTVC